MRCRARRKHNAALLVLPGGAERVLHQIVHREVGAKQVKVAPYPAVRTTDNMQGDTFRDERGLQGENPAQTVAVGVLGRVRIEYHHPRVFGTGAAYNGFGGRPAQQTVRV